MGRLARALALLATGAFLVLIIPFLILMTFYVFSGLVPPVPALVVMLAYCILVAGLVGFWRPRSRLGGRGPGDLRGGPADRRVPPAARRISQGLALLATVVFLTLTVPFIVLTADFWMRNQLPLAGPIVPVILMYAIVIIAIAVFWIRQL
ncbi:MAG: hypothetical protein KGN00_04865, partial [Chloroflexota bacterium]|nr:hypothetical protein [Chloroflexota bacterium]